MHRCASLIVAVAACVMAAGSASAAVHVLRLDMGDDGLMAGWDSEANGNNRFDKPDGDSADPASVTADFDGDGNTETVRIGYNAWSDAEQNSDPRPLAPDFDTTWPAGYGTELQEDFSSPNADTGAMLIIWNLPEGDYRVTLYMRDWQYASTTYQVRAHDATLFSVDHADKIDGDLSSISDTHTLSTTPFDPAHADWDEQPSIYFLREGGKGAVMGIEIEFVPEVAPEPATLGLLAIGGALLGVSARRRRA